MALCPDWIPLYSNDSRGHRQKKNVDGLIPCVIEPDEKARPNRNWARLIQNIYEVDTRPSHFWLNDFKS